MKLYSVTITGLDNSTDINEILELSAQYPWLEWGVLLSETRMGQPRYPNAAWLNSLYRANMAYQGNHEPRFAAHLCGATQREFVSGTKHDHTFNDSWLKPFRISPGRFGWMFGRVQVNFNAKREGYGTGTMIELINGWHENYSGHMITQHNENNSWVWESIQREEIGQPSVHQILHDASGGRGKSPDTWAKPIAGVLNGYAGGIRPNTVLQTLDQLEQIVGDGYIWIDMEGGVRDESDKMNMPAVHHMLKEISLVAQDRKWF